MLNAVNEFTPLLCLCLRPSLVKSCPLIKVLPLSSFRLGTHTHTHALHMKQTDERSRYPCPSGSHGICGMLLYFPLNSLVFVFFCRVSSNACMRVCVLLVPQRHTLPDSGYQVHTVGSISLVSRLRQEDLKDNILLQQHVCQSSPKGNYKKKLHISTSKPTQRRMLLLRCCSFITQET